jgi:hypothetical protein
MVASLQQQLLQNGSSSISRNGSMSGPYETEGAETNHGEVSLNGINADNTSTDEESNGISDEDVDEFFGNAESDEWKPNPRTERKPFEKHERIDRDAYEQSIEEEDLIAFNSMSPEIVHLPRCRREGSIIPPEVIGELSSLLQHQTGFLGLISPGNSLASGVKRVDWGMSASKSRRGRVGADENLLPFVQEADWLGARDEHASATKRLAHVQQELRKYQEEPEKVTIASSLRWMVRNITASVLTAVNLIVPLMLFLRAAIVHVRPYISDEGVVYYYSFLSPDEERSSPSTIWFTAEILLFSYLTAAALTGLYHSGLLSHFKLLRHRTGMHKIIVCIYFTLIVATALPVTARILGIISFDLMGNYDNMGYLKNQLLTSTIQIIFAVLLAKRYLEFFPWTSYFINSVKRLFDWADRPISD